MRLNIEIRRLRTWVHNESKCTTKVISALSTSDPHLSVEIHRRWQLRKAVNNIHLQRLDAIEKLPGFTGIQGIGLKEGTTSLEAPSDAEREGRLEADIESLDNEMANDDFDEQLSTITDFMLGIHD